MRIILVNHNGVFFHSNVLQEKSVEKYCSCSSQKEMSPRDIELRDNNIFIVVPDGEYVAIVCRKHGSTDTPIRQRNLEGVSIFTTNRFMVLIRFFRSYSQCLAYLNSQQSLKDDDKYIVSTKKIDKIPSNEIFLYESSFGDVFSGFQENYSNESSTALQTNLKRSSYSGLSSSYPLCWL